MRGCRRARTAIQGALERELALEERFQLDLHLASCGACAELERRALALEELLEGALDPAPNAPDVEAAVRGVFAALERGEGRPWRPRRRALRATGWLVAGLALAGLTWAALRARAAETTVDAAAPLAAADGFTGPDAGWTPAGVQLAVRAALLEGWDEADPAAALARFQARLREPARAGFSLRRFVEAELDDPDAGLARRAALCLGTLGDTASAAALERALARAPVTEAALDALVRLGDAGVPALERALEEPELAHRALMRLCRVGGERAAQAIERRIRRSGPDADPSRAALLDALTSTGRPAVRALLRLAELEPAEEANTILARLPLVADSGDELVRMLSDGRVREDVALRALELLQPAAGVAWLEERCAEHRSRAAALATLARYAGPAPLGAALRLAQAGRVPREDALALLGRLLDADHERAEAFTLELETSADALALRDWMLFLLDSEQPGAARSLARLAFCTKLGDDDRQWAALVVGELGAPEDGALLVELLAGREAEDRRRTAACLLALHALQGAAGVELALAPCSAASRQRVLSALEEQGRPGEAVLLHRVARVLDGALAELAAADRTPREIL